MRGKEDKECPLVVEWGIARDKHESIKIRYRHDEEHVFI